MAASGNPNRRDPALTSADSFPGDAESDAWPSFGPEHDVNVVLKPMKDGAPFELESHLGDRHCDFWDSLQIH